MFLFILYDWGFSKLEYSILKIEEIYNFDFELYSLGSLKFKVYFSIPKPKSLEKPPTHASPSIFLIFNSPLLRLKRKRREHERKQHEKVNAKNVTEGY